MLLAVPTSVLIYTLLANCAAQGIDPEIYLTEAIRLMSAGATPE